LRNGLVPWAPIATGNIISAVVCIAVMVFVANLRGDVPQLTATLKLYANPLNLFVGTGSLVLLLGSFAVRKPSGAAPPTTEPCVEPAATDNEVSNG
jgi:hypothetical protein